MTTTTHRLATSFLATPPVPRDLTRRLLRLVPRLVRVLYADRPVTSLGTPGYADELPSQRYAELAVLRHR